MIDNIRYIVFDLPEVDPSIINKYDLTDERQVRILSTRLEDHGNQYLLFNINPDTGLIENDMYYKLNNYIKISDKTKGEEIFYQKYIIDKHILFNYMIGFGYFKEQEKIDGMLTDVQVRDILLYKDRSEWFDLLNPYIYKEYRYNDLRFHKFGKKYAISLETLDKDYKAKYNLGDIVVIDNTRYMIFKLPILDPSVMITYTNKDKLIYDIIENGYRYTLIKIIDGKYKERCFNPLTKICNFKLDKRTKEEDQFYQKYIIGNEEDKNIMYKKVFGPI